MGKKDMPPESSDPLNPQKPDMDALPLAVRQRIMAIDQSTHLLEFDDCMAAMRIIKDAYDAMRGRESSLSEADLNVIMGVCADGVNRILADSLGDTIPELVLPPTSTSKNTSKPS